MTVMQKLQQLLLNSRSTIVLTGAGVSTLSGIPDFRSPGGIYSQKMHGLNVEEILSLACFEAHPEYFYEWAAGFVYRVEDFQPTVVHRVCAELERRGMVRRVYTQNIDLLHTRAGSPNVGELHGSPAQHRCLDCGAHCDYATVAPIVRAGKVPHCPRCGGVLKPEIVFYGECLDETLLEEAYHDLSRCDLMLVLGSSLVVHPAAGLPLIAHRNGGKLVIVNAQPTPLDDLAVLHFNDLQSVFTELAAWLAALPKGASHSC